MRIVLLLLAVLAVLWFGGAFLGWFQIDYKRGHGPKTVGEWIAMALGWLAILAGILFLLAKALL